MRSFNDFICDTKERKSKREGKEKNASNLHQKKKKYTDYDKIKGKTGGETI